MYLDNFKNYLEAEKKYSTLTVNAYTKDLEEFIDYLESIGISFNKNIEYTFIRNWIVFLSKNKISPNSINRKVSSLKAYFKFLVNIKEIKKSPLRNHTSLRTKSKVVNPLNETEMKEVFELFKTSKKELTRDSIIIDILYSTGLRRAELINLKKSDIYFDDQVIKVLGKRNKERLVPMLPGLVKKLKLYSINIKEDSFLLQSKNGNKISPSTIYRVVNKYLRNISTKTKISPHVLRHTFATHILNNGADINSIKEILGHKSLASTQIYTKVKIPTIVNDYMKNHPRQKK
ncbi:MAG: tyrosine-type recombinase/integrase [Flavobacteriaceae bacterium]|tara:strand:+ start:2829 stop:3695 length:867 start_codon:yes stop_codon:yes gene_type:complete